MVLPNLNHFFRLELLFGKAKTEDYSVLMVIRHKKKTYRRTKQLYIRTLIVSIFTLRRVFTLFPEKRKPLGSEQGE